MTADELIAKMNGDGAETPVKVESLKRWGTVYVRPPNVAEFEKLKKQWKRSDEEEMADEANRVLMAAHYICDESGKRVLDPENPDHLAVLAARRGEDIAVIINTALGGDAPGN